MELTFDALREKIPAWYHPDLWVVECNEEAGVHLKHTKNSDVTVHHYPCPELQTYLQKEHDFNGLVHREVSKQNQDIRSDVFNVMIEHEQKWFRIEFTLKREETLLSLRCDRWQLNNEWHSTVEVEIPFDPIPQLMRAWVSELPEYRLHFVTGNVNMS